MRAAILESRISAIQLVSFENINELIEQSSQSTPQQPKQIDPPTSNLPLPKANPPPPTKQIPKSVPPMKYPGPPQNPHQNQATLPGTGEHSEETKQTESKPIQITHEKAAVQKTDRPKIVPPQNFNEKVPARPEVQKKDASQTSTKSEPPKIAQNPTQPQRKQKEEIKTQNEKKQAAPKQEHHERKEPEKEITYEKQTDEYENENQDDLY